MKLKTTLLLLLLTGVTAVSAQWQNKTMTFETVSRQYRVYVPANYNPSNPASLVFTLHGLGDNMTNFSGIGMNQVADTANIIVVVPQALTDPMINATAWNSGAGYMGYYANSTVNDVGFINALIDSVSASYSIDPQKVFSCGFSMGGFMTERLALELNTRIKAFASVAGTFGNGLLPVQNPGRAVSVAHFHGTSDGTIAYAGNNYGNDVVDLINFWVQNNNCGTTPVHTNLPDLVSDGYTVEHDVYSGGDNQTVVELFKVNGADHTWLTAANDISYTVEIWKFFNRYMSATLAVNELKANESMTVFPNPATDHVSISCPTAYPVEAYTLTISDLSGKACMTEQFQFDGQAHTLPFNPTLLQKGMYLVRVENNHREQVMIEKVLLK